MIGMLLAMLVQIEAAPAEPKPVVTTIAAIRANPKRFDGQIVRLHGYVNHCQPSSCSIEERVANGPAGAGEHLSIAPNAKFDTTVKPLLPTYVEFDARFDATCVTSPNCTDRAPELTIVTLRSVVSPEPPEIEK